MEAFFMDVAARRQYATPLIHDIDAITTFDANATAVPSILTVDPQGTGVLGQAPTVTLTSTGGAHTVTVELVVHGVDYRQLNVAVPIRVTGSLSSGTPLVGFLGFAFLYVTQVTYLVKTSIAAGDTVNVGFDLSSTDVVVLADQIFASSSVATPLAKVASGLATEGRHKRWTGGARPTSTAGQLVLATPPKEAA